MVKHILTTKCPRKCPYCISRNINIAEETNYLEMLVETMNIYSSLSKEHDSITLTGGEPSCANFFPTFIYFAKLYFKNVFLTTQNKCYLYSIHASEFDAINFSWHNISSDNFIKITHNTKVYCSILSDLYNDALPKTLANLGYAGLTINENHFGKETFDATNIPQIENFSIRINRRGECFKKNTVYIMPDLSIRTSFEDFLK